MPEQHTWWFQSPNSKQCTSFPETNQNMLSTYSWLIGATWTFYIVMVPFQAGAAPAVSWKQQKETGEGLAPNKCALPKVIIFVYYPFWYDLGKKWRATSLSQNATILRFYAGHPVPQEWLLFCLSLWAKGREIFLEERVQVLWTWTWPNVEMDTSFSSCHSFLLGPSSPPPASW